MTTQDAFEPTKYSNTENLLPVGTVLNETYRIERCIGAGNFGIAYLAYDMQLLRTVAVKEFFLADYVVRSNDDNYTVISKNSKYDTLVEERKKKFTKEAGIMDTVGKTEVSVPIFDYFEQNNTAYIVMEYLDGMNLEDYLSKRGRLSVKETMNIILPLAKSLSKIHKQNIIHRDIKPGNVIIMPDNTPRLLDFGNAREIQTENDGKTVLVFTENYAAVEQFSVFAPKGPWTDVYSLCAVMYRCLLGANPKPANERGFLDDPDKELLCELTGVIGADNTELAEALVKGMQLDAQDRYQSMDELLEDLLPLMEGASVLDKFKAKVHRLINRITAPIKKKIRKIGIKKTIIYALISMISVATVTVLAIHFIGERYRKDVHLLGDGQIVYLNAKEGAATDDIERAFDIIRKRLKRLCGNNKFVFYTDRDQAELFVPYDVFGKMEPKKVLEQFVLRPQKTFLVYDFNHYMEIPNNAIESLEFSKDNIVLSLSEDCAAAVVQSVSEWNTLETRIDGGEIIYSEVESLQDTMQDNKSVDNVFDRTLNICFDYDLTAKGLMNWDTDYFRVTGVDEDGKTLNLSSQFMDARNREQDTEMSLADSDRLKKLLLWNIKSNHFDATFDIEYGAVALWERDNKTGDDNIEWGMRQKNPDYFVNNGIAATDVVFEFCGEDDFDNEIGHNVWLGNRQWVSNVLDEAQIDYSVGSSPYDDREMILRLPSELTGDCYYDLLEAGVVWQGIDRYVEDNQESMLSYISQVPYTDFSQEGLMYDNGCVTVDIREGEWSSLYEELSGDDGKLESGDSVIFRLNDKHNNYLLGVYDAENKKAVFDTSTFGEDGSIPKSFSSYVNLFNALMNRAVDGEKCSLDGYCFTDAVPVCTDADDAKADHIPGLHEGYRNAKENELATELANVLGTKPEVRVSSYDVCVVELLQNPGEHYAENICRLLEMTVSICKERMEDVFDSDYGRLFFNIRNLEGVNNARIMIEGDGAPGEAHVEIEYWDYLLSDSDRDALPRQLLLLKEKMLDSELFESYDIMIKRFHESGIVENTTIFSD